jgi:hypothetical protein
MTELRAGFVYGSHLTLRTNLLPPSLGGPVWPQAIQRSGVEIIFFLFEHRSAALYLDRPPAAQACLLNHAG